ncbi:PEP/pyruvate-binding domain-containing protein [Frankia sp. R82]|uniref:PEP/pyruvate-binding domain-containing protein n=1 Tax=Frankia sp. R82 TaxID=2950553 RepID=UPI002043AB9E|nr:PEP/pyruvate-binding domain-containing protein [Frankia sp. R82]MCM3883539.1 PEP-utilizing enzyme [Frankia sp. R82]
MTFAEVTGLADATDRARHGRKAAALATLIAQGLPVPDGLVLPADLTDAQIEGAVPDIVAWARSHAVRFGLVVRSSAPEEDGPQASFAGLYASRFTRIRPPALLAAIREVRAGATAPAVAAYAAHRHIHLTGRLAVLIQPAIRARAAGVLAADFDPTGRLRRWALDAVHGLAVPVVNGSQRGEHHHSDRDSPVPAEQDVLLLPGTARELRRPPGEWIELPAEKGLPPHRVKIQTSADGLLQLHATLQAEGHPLVTPPTRDRLLRLAGRAAAALGLDQIDIEWAATGGRTLYILQARPLTGPIPEPHTDTPSDDDAAWHGIPASPGRGGGPAHHVRAAAATPAGGAGGAVIICDNIGPDALDALLAGPAAIAATSGGPLSHAAIVARELGVPCVTALPADLHTIKPGTLLTVDGTAGTVQITAVPEASSDRQRTSLADAAVVTSALPARPPDDGRQATILLYLPGGALPFLPNDAEGASCPAEPPIGVLQPSDQPPLPPLPAGYQEHRVEGLGRLAWPSSAGPLPSRLVVLNLENLIYERPTGAVGPL